MLNAPGSAPGVGADIAIPIGSLAQKWVFTGKGDGLYAIQPAHDMALCLAILGTKVDSGTKVVAEANQGCHRRGGG